ncbi:Glycosyltransferase involved in cell wall bisynthesis [Halopenitus malekzadehii]|uniref:Glycosyltransferase involved in cell wall bisynthesis n=1 Tax=Halopenitus malekzadehii TaxID=1267564 RepID=A0A1H6HP88_9EURY|nr:glycosyltransferase family A protein [Halopenitus malekzadehii]SEH37591.1 Glycosyltransferase involved in cell wall bisynthesis [Halopenitus malekzadehii]
MNISVVVPTLNGRDQLADGLDALSAHAPAAEVIVVNGPSADGTTGMVRDREDVDVLVEISDRSVTVARNAGIEVATGEVIALVDYDNRIDPEWIEGVRAGLEHAGVVTGPVARPLRAGQTADSAERRRIAGRNVTYFAGGNVVFRSDALEELDGFDEYLEIGGARDAAHRLAGLGYEVGWESALSVERDADASPAADGGRPDRDWGWKYRALAYRLAKNYGLRPTVIRRIAAHAFGDSTSVARDVITGAATPTGWIANGRDVLLGTTTGFSDGMVARARDRTSTRNPYGLSKRADRAVAKYDRRGDAEDASAADIAGT